MFGSRERERKKREERKGEKEEREERKEKQNLKIKDFIYKNKNLLEFFSFTKLFSSFWLQNKRGLYRPPQGMKIQKNL